MSSDLPSTATLLARLMRHDLPEIELSLGRMERFLEAAGSPHLRLPPVIHVAGTNGKGSLIACLRAMLEAGGYSVHVYTSPHLVRFHERIVLAGEKISDAELRRRLARVDALRAEFPLTFFESATVAAFLAFSEHPADVLLLETGMGGRCDATNVLPAPALTVIMPVSLDHREFLGESVEAIAKEKAGILKAGVLCVVGVQEAAAHGVIERAAAALGAPLFRHGQEWAVEPAGEGFSYRSAAWHLEGMKSALPGAFQCENAAAALACTEILQPLFPLEEEALRRGVASARWPARLQYLPLGTQYADVLGEGWHLWLDGGHNPAAGEALAAWVRERGAPPHLVLGMIRGKDAAGYLRPLAPLLASLTVCAIPGEEKAYSAAELQEIAATLGVGARAADSPLAALEALRQAHPAGGEALIAGSLYLAGAVLAG
jgi:dihydrofolate synthase/folylpolyglutamate synthase